MLVVGVVGVLVASVLKRWFPRVTNVGIAANILIRLAAGVSLIATAVKAAEKGGFYWLLTLLCALVALPMVAVAVGMLVLFVRGWDETEDANSDQNSA